MAKTNENEKTKLIKNAQDRKDYSIAYFNATNSAIEMAKLIQGNGNTIIDAVQYRRTLKKEVRYWKKFFLSEHTKYRNDVTEKIGAKMSPADAIGKLKATKTLAELKQVWVSLTQDERQDEEINNACKMLKESYETVQRN